MLVPREEHLKEKSENVGPEIGDELAVQGGPGRVSRTPSATRYEA